MTRTRPNWDQYFLDIANVVRTRSDCERDQVGAVITIENRIVSTGYNGAPADMIGCEGCPRRTSAVAPGSNYDNCVALHAEANALLYARTDLRGATLYVTREPCIACAKLIIGSGVKTVVIPDEDGSPYRVMETVAGGWGREGNMALVGV